MDYRECGAEEEELFCFCLKSCFVSCVTHPSSTAACTRCQSPRSLTPSRPIRTPPKWPRDRLLNAQSPWVSVYVCTASALLYSFTKCRQEQSTGLSYERPAFKRFSAAILTSRHNWGSLFLPQQEVCFHSTAPRALTFVFLPHSLSTLPAPQATHYNGKSTLSLRSWESGFPL